MMNERINQMMISCKRSSHDAWLQFQQQRLFYKNPKDLVESIHYFVNPSADSIHASYIHQLSQFGGHEATDSWARSASLGYVIKQ
jgi:hypothetical protein